MSIAFGKAEPAGPTTARLAQSAERKALNLVVVGSSPTVGVFVCQASGQQGRAWGAMLHSWREKAAASPSAKGDSGPCNGCRPRCEGARYGAQLLRDSCETLHLLRN